MELIFRELISYLSDKYPWIDTAFRVDQFRINWRYVLSETGEYKPPYLVIGLGDPQPINLGILTRSESIPISLALVIENQNFVFSPIGSGFTASPSGMLYGGDRLYDSAGPLSVLGVSGGVIALSRTPSGVSRFSDPILWISQRMRELANDLPTHQFSEFYLIDKPTTDPLSDAMSAILERGADMYAGGLNFSAVYTDCLTT